MLTFSKNFRKGEIYVKNKIVKRSYKIELVFNRGVGGGGINTNHGLRHHSRRKGYTTRSLWCIPLRRTTKVTTHLGNPFTTTGRTSS